MTTIAFIFACVGIVLFGLLCISTADMIRTYRSNRKSEAAALSKRQHDQAVAQFAAIFREAMLLRGKK